MMKPVLCALAFPSLLTAAPPDITAPLPFSSPPVDAIISRVQLFPKDNAINSPVTDWPLHPDSPEIVASVGNDKPLRYNPDMAYVIVPPDQKRVPVKLGGYADESDPGPYPVPDSVPIEGWPAFYQRDEKLARLTLAQVQRDTMELGGDRHASVLDPVAMKLYEFYALRWKDNGWQAAQASVFDLTSNQTRPPGWTSTDAAGLPLLPLTVRHDELECGVINHALRVTVRKSRKGYVAPATHYASRLTAPELPRMGERFRLRKDFDVSGFSPPVRTILTALKTYGMIVADNGIEWAVSVTPDLRIPEMHEELRRVKGSDFEVVTSPQQ